MKRVGGIFEAERSSKALCGWDQAECCQGREKRDRMGLAMCTARSGSMGHVTELDIILRPVGTRDKGVGG